ncbi:MAG: hypothetical protein L6Q92_09365 [Phycisphaerae bacterium]|nr:hypothetical protein [Phycisphaerae bacterium]MCK6497957.1 hypothetical protein [Nitrospira sp.]
MNRTDPITLCSLQNDKPRRMIDSRCGADRAWLIVVCALALPLFGCTATKSSRGWMSRPEVGKPFADFIYIDDQGIQRSLGNQLADFTVLAFTRCDRDTHAPVSGTLREIVAENRSTPLVKVVGVDVHWFEGRCDHTQCHLVADERDLLSICDATGAVRRLYGLADADRVFVIGPDHRVAFAASYNDLNDLRKHLRDSAAQISERRARELSQEYQSIGY